MVIGQTLFFFLGWYLLEIIGRWKMFVKAGLPAWKAVIPFYATYTESKCIWEGKKGLLFCALMVMSQMYDTLYQDTVNQQSTPFMMSMVVFLVIYTAFRVMYFNKLSQAFGKGKGYVVLLFFVEPLARIALGFGNANYRTNFKK